MVALIPKVEGLIDHVDACPRERSTIANLASQLIECVGPLHPFVHNLHGREGGLIFADQNNVILHTYLLHKFQLIITSRKEVL